MIEARCDRQGILGWRIDLHCTDPLLPDRDDYITPVRLGCEVQACRSLGSVDRQTIVLLDETTMRCLMTRASAVVMFRIFESFFIIHGSIFAGEV